MDRTSDVRGTGITMKHRQLLNREELEHQRVSAVVYRILVANSAALIAISIVQFWITDIFIAGAGTITGS